MKVCVTIPAYNEAAAIGPLVEEIKKKNLSVVVIDDGSTDNTGDIARRAGAFVLRHENKKGKGASLRDGFAYALKENFDGVLTMDGDGQHAPEDIDLFLAKASQHPRSIILGSRMDNPRGMPLIRFLTNKIMSAVISRIAKQDMPDTQCGFRFISTAVLREVQVASSDFEAESEILIESNRKSFKIYSVPIKTIYRNEKSKINPLMDTIRFVKYLLRTLRSKRT
ncbi:MAG: glycosyltransferase family 2 protein [Candidatus Omnitrophota bacterium]